MRRLVYGMFCAVFFSGVVSAQISPGDLFKGHQHLEGIDQCTSCHTVGKTLANDRCLDCHKEIQHRLTQNKGFHSSVSSKQCVECHKDHHGRNFQIIHFEKKSFDHTAAGFVLDGKHANTDCEKCHTPKYIVAKEIQELSPERKESTFLGLSKECSSCHTDEHRGQFKQQCSVCHTTKSWKPAALFSHEKTAFKLTGAHLKNECVQCHKKTWDHGSVTQFIGLEFSSCASCHTDPHKGKFKQECSQCHVSDSWRRVSGKLFDHSLTSFPLKEKHAALQCNQCHQNNPKLKNVSGEIGFHITKFQSCSNCHSDAHDGQFKARKDGGACESCHSEKGFIPARYGITEHSQSRFPLTGSHIATPCGNCHPTGKIQAKSTRQFRWSGTIECTVCHRNVHGNQFSKKMINGCETCHTNETWQELTFSHEKTTFSLRGKHSVVSCNGCHKPVNGVVQYEGISPRCSACHQDQHAGQFAKNGTTECERCHTELSWRTLNFDHNTQSRFALTGKHSTVQCAKCHKETIVNKKRIIKYKPLEAACVDCHPAQ